MRKINISYWGNSYEMIQYILASEKFNLTEVVIEQSKVTESILTICNQTGIEIKQVRNKMELMHIAQSLNMVNVLVYCFGIIIPRTVFEKMRIINIHPGSLRFNRGAHSLLWSIIIPGLGAEICAYRICVDEVDSGELIASYTEECNENERPIELLKRLEKHIPAILEALYYYFQGTCIGTEMVQGGIYRPRVTEKDYTIDLKKDNKEIIKRKINSQTMYKGAILIDDRRTIRRIVGYQDMGDVLELIDDRGESISVFIEEGLA